MKKKNKKSPLKDKPLRYAGQSIDEEIDKLINEDTLPYLVVCLVTIAFAINEWWHYFKNPKPSPILTTFVALGFVSFFVFKFFKLKTRLKSLKLGRDGERAVGQYLDNLREFGYKIFHDILADGFNIDHVIISRKGVFAIETKTYSKPYKGEPQIIFDGVNLSIKGIGVQSQPISQALASSQWLQRLLEETTGKKFPVKPVVLFPGWYITSTFQGKKSGIWVLEPKALPAFLKNQPALITQDDVALITYHLSRYIRTNVREL